LAAEAGARRFLGSVSSGAAGGLAAYRPGERPSPAMTAEALYCRLVLGAGAADPAAEGVAIAAEQVAAYRSIAQGVHLMAIKAEHRIPQILRLAGLGGAAGGEVGAQQLGHGLLLR
jgi:hypothetical protein